MVVVHALNESRSLNHVLRSECVFHSSELRNEVEELKGKQKQMMEMVKTQSGSSFSTHSCNPSFEPCSVPTLQSCYSINAKNCRHSAKSWRPVQTVCLVSGNPF
jgi:hypothetical protein